MTGGAMTTQQGGQLLEDLTRRSFDEDWQKAGSRRVAGMPIMKGVGDLSPSILRSMFNDKAPELRDAPSSASLQWGVALRAFRDRRHAEGFGLQRIAEDCEKLAASCARLRSYCESPIEHQIAPWLLCQNYGQWTCGAPVTHIPKEDDIPPDADLMLVPQFAFARFRLDFALVAKIREHVKIVAIECDGEDFHDHRRDFRRDRYLLGWNIPTVRATGSEISRNPRHVAELVARQILDWGCSLGLRP